MWVRIYIILRCVALRYLTLYYIILYYIILYYIILACKQNPARKLSANLYDLYHWYVYSVGLLMIHRGTVRNMYSFIPKINLRN